MQQATTITNSAGHTGDRTNHKAAKPYHTPSFTHLGKVEELTGQTTRRTTTRTPPPTATTIPSGGTS